MVSVAKEKILLEKPNYSSLRRKGFIPVDMHLHSTASMDSSITVEEIIAVAKKNGFGVSITDHNSIAGSVNAAPLAKKEGVLLIPGIEVTAKEGVHILCYFKAHKDLKLFYSKELQGNMLNPMRSKLSHIEIIERVFKLGGLASAAHPFSYGCGLYTLPNHAEMKFVEGLNGSLLDGTNKKSRELKGKIFTGGSDAHLVEYLGRTVTCVKAKTPAQFLSELKKDRQFIVGRSTGFIEKIGVMVRKELRLWRRMNPFQLLRNRLRQAVPRSG